MTNKLPPEIYRRRRIAALVLLLILLVLVGWGISALVNRDSEDADPVNVTRDDGKKVTPSEKPKEPYAPNSDKDKAAKGEENDKGDKDSSDSAKDDANKALAEKKDCTLADLQITATSDQPNYGAEQPTLAMTIHNPTGGECRINLDEQQLRFEVYDLATYERMWSDVDCNDSEGHGELVLAPGEEVSYAAKWSRLTSAPNKCSETDRVEVPSGSYLFYGLIGDNNSDAYTFNLR
ncbi:MAG: hypothetical protein Q4E11_08515 [Corynebacterium sp.]|uniref:hypothetical protein n=1 Tax=Corynebacterium sp. TaxID=1720 RepID=UPI0026DCD9E2|nr:hypothetical protein [Corynebacterium sp.]MDO5030609.1 hypothetical protein [Corynebacterium sp.]